jgi:hypothetical protein
MGSNEYNMRQAIFSTNMAKRDVVNSQNRGYNEGPTIFSDWTMEEIGKMFTAQMEPNFKGKVLT